MAVLGASLPPSGCRYPGGRKGRQREGRREPGGASEVNHATRGHSANPGVLGGIRRRKKGGRERVAAADENIKERYVS